MYLLRRCYGILYRLLLSSEPVSEELMPIVSPSIIHMLTQVNSKNLFAGQQALNRQKVPQRGAKVWWIVQRKGSISRESPTSRLCHASSPLYILKLMRVSSLSKYQLALYQIDSLRVDGRFHGADGSIPEGQGIVMANLNECHELLEMVCSSS